MISKPLISQDLFAPPVNIPVFLSANFAELRADHFHSGIDIKTQGITGIKVLAAADGYVSRIVVSPAGFGRALYLQHKSGYLTVYAHLQSFAPEIEEYVKRQQYNQKSYTISLNPPVEKFVFKQGDLIGYSGNTGSSGGPHLHFEVRKIEGEKPVNPLIFNLGVEDNLKPLIERLVIYPANKGTLINGYNKRLTLMPTGKNGNYSLGENNAVKINGIAGFGISCRDLMNNTSNRFGVNYLELQIDSVSWFICNFNEFSFSETRYINAHIDYEAFIKNNILIHRMFVLPNNRLSMYRTYLNNGLFDFNDGNIHQIKIIVEDSYGNKSELNFKVKALLDSEIDKTGPQPDVVNDDKDANKSIMLMPFGKSNIFRNDSITVSIPKNALYDTILFTWFSERRKKGFLSPVHSIHDRYTPLHLPINISIKTDSLHGIDPSKLLIVSIDESNRLTPAGGTYSNGYVTANISQFGNYTVTADTIPPVITPQNFSQNSDMSAIKELRVRITDNLSGIKSYTGMIDGKWALFEYDPKRDLIFYRFDADRIAKGSKHTLKITVTDNNNNTSVLQKDFFW